MLTQKFVYLRQKLAKILAKLMDMGIYGAVLVEEVASSIMKLRSSFFILCSFG